MRPLLRYLATGAIVLPALLASPASASPLPRDLGEFRLEKLLYRWDRTSEKLPGAKDIYALDPRGEFVVFARGEKKPRLHLRDLHSGEEKRLSELEIFGRLPPRIAPDRSIFFTAVEARVEKKKRLYVVLGIFRASPEGDIERVLPRKRQVDGRECAILRDVSADGKHLLVGEALTIRDLDVPHGGFRISLREWSVDDWQRRDLKLYVHARALSFYHRDGRGIFFTRDWAKPQMVQKISYLSRRGGDPVELEHNRETTGRPAGDLLGFDYLVPHVGSFRRDENLRVAVARASGSPKVRLRWDPAVAIGERLRLLEVRGPLFFLREAGAERLYLFRANRAVLDDMLARAYRPPPLSPLQILACRGDEKSLELLRRVRATLRPHDWLPRNVRVEYHQGSDRPPEQYLVGVAALSSSIGKTRIRREIPEPETGQVYHEYLGFDLKTSWMQSPIEGIFELSHVAREIEQNNLDPYRILFDPVGLDDPRVRYRYAGRQRRAGRQVIVLAFEYDDGFAGEVEIDPSTHHPARIVTPLDPFVNRHRGQLGKLRVEKREITFSDYREERGLVFPRSIEFEDGLTYYYIKVRSVTWEPNLPDSVYRKPSPPH